MTTYRTRSSRLPWAIAAAAVVLAGAAVGLYVSTGSASPNAAGGRSTTSTTARGSTGSTFAPGGTSGEQVVSADPGPGDAQVAPDSSVTVEMSDPVAVGSPEPALSPKAPGTWALTGPRTYTFTASDGLLPDQSYVVTVPGGAGGVTATSGQRLAKTQRWSFRVQGSLTRLQQLLALLGYLPVRFLPASPAAVAPDEAAMPQPGSFAWRWADPPIQMTALWLPDDYNEMVTGAVMTFESQHGLNVDGLTGPAVWSSLIAAYLARDVDPAAYNFVYVQKVPTPENLTLWSNGRKVFSTSVNTGNPDAQTPDGTFTVFEHHPSVTMSGPGYSDPGVPWVSYFHQGDALHGFLRASYGSEQSLGCVEMPYDAAQTVYPYTPIGTLVSIQ